MRRTDLFSAARGFTLVEIMIVVLIIGVLLAIAAPAFARARDGARSKACRKNMLEIVSAKERWAMGENHGPSDVPTDADLAPFYVRTKPVCPSSGTYVLGALKDEPTCTVGGVPGAYDAHVLW